jgi:hypothetical protein
MKSAIAARTLFILGMAVASGAFAGSSEVRKCVTESGHVTLTDDACPTGSETVKIISGPGDAEAAVASEPARPATERYLTTRMPKRYATLMKSPTPARGLALDASTLRAARANMQIFDHAAQSLRSQRLAALQ